MPELTGDSGGGQSHRENIKQSNRYSVFDNLLANMVGYLAAPETVLRLKLSDEQVAQLNTVRDKATTFFTGCFDVRGPQANAKTRKIRYD